MTRLTRQSVTALALAAAVALATSTTPIHAAATYADMMRARKAGKPNIVLIVVDDLTCAELGASSTPRFDQLAADGLRFTQAYTGAVDPTLARAVLLTGFRPHRIPIDGDCPPGFLPAASVTVAEVLQAAGYRTGAVGHWNLGGPGSPGAPNAQGFDEWLGCQDAEHARDVYPAYLWRNERRLAISENATGKKGLRAADFFARAALNFVRSHQHVPLFLYWAYPAPKPEDRRALPMQFDAHLGQMLDLLRELRLEETTALFVVGDCGAAFPVPGVTPGPTNATAASLRLGNLADRVLRVPFVIRWKGHVPAGKVSSQVCGFLDFLPTAAELARTSPASGFEGLSLMPALAGHASTEVPRLLSWETRRPVLRQALRQGDWKALRTAPDHPIELYRLTEDSAEATNVAALHPDVVKELTGYLRRNGE